MIYKIYRIHDNDNFFNVTDNVNFHLKYHSLIRLSQSDTKQFCCVPRNVRLDEGQRRGKYENVRRMSLCFHSQSVIIQLYFYETFTFSTKVNIFLSILTNYIFRFI